MLVDTNELLKLFIGALTLVASLAWNDAFKSLFSRYPRLRNYGPWVYAIFVTILVFILINILNNLSNNFLGNNTEKS